MVRFPAVLLALALTSATGAALTEEAPPAPAAEPTTGETRVRVVADSGGDDVAPIGASTSLIDVEDDTLPAAAITDLVVAAPGVSENGQGGLFQVVSIRGVSGQRVMPLIEDMRIVTERRAGAAVSFVDPRLVGEIEIVRGPSTTYHGSGAVGGVMHLFPRAPSSPFAETGWSSDTDESFVAAGTGGDDWSVAAARRSAVDTRSPSGTPLNVGFTQYSAVARVRRGGEHGTWEALVVPTYGEDIGKSNIDYPARVTNYPRERHLLARLGYEADAGWSARVWAHANDLQTAVDDGDETSFVLNESVDVGAGWQTRAALGERIGLRWGVDLFGRRGVDAEEELTDVPAATTQRFSSLANGRETELGGFAVARFTHRRTAIEAGARYSWQDQDNDGSGGGGTARTAIDGFLGGRHSIGDRLEVSAGVRSGSRFPSLTELFFSGTTGRGRVLGNPDLSKERAFGVETGLRWIGRRLLLHGAVFNNRVKDYIERIDVAPDLRSFVNLTSGTIRGAELQGVWRVDDAWSLEWGGHALRGRDSDDNPLADVPPNEVYGGASWRGARLRADGRAAWRDDKTDPGPGEVAIPSVLLLSAAVELDVAADLRLGVVGRNLLDERYLRSADDKASEALGRSIGVRLSWRPK